MLTLHVSRRAVDIVEAIAAGGLATAVMLLAVITAATLLYVWMIG
jgi:hypothetical protein